LKIEYIFGYISGVDNLKRSGDLKHPHPNVTLPRDYEPCPTIQPTSAAEIYIL
jgi:hypothetical protein